MAGKVVKGNEIATIDVVLVTVQGYGENDDEIILDEEKLKAKTDEKAKAEQIAELKKELADTDYEAIKYSEGWFTEEEYAPIKAQRQAWRDRINELEKQ